MRLRNLCNKDVGFMLEWMRDKDISQYFRFDTDKVTEESIADFIRSANESEHDRHYAIVNDDDEYLGTISLKNIDTNNKNAEYAIALRSCAIGSGAAAWATQSIIKEAFTTLGLHKVYLNVLAYNTRAIRFYEKMGFTYEGEFKEHVMIKNKLEDIKWYGITKENTNV